MTTPSAAIRSAIDPWYTAPIVPVLQRRRSALIGSLEGSVLVLTGPPAVLPTEVGPHGSSDEPRYDHTAYDHTAYNHTVYNHIVTVGWLSAADNLDRALGDLLRRLAPDGWLHSIEPTRGSASIARAQRVSAPVGRLRTGWHLGRDLPAALRHRALAVTDVERFGMPVSSVVLRPWVQTRARRRVDPSMPTAPEEAP